jgi:phosphatidylinositol alpha-1,6-mannosyltransferase
VVKKTSTAATRTKILLLTDSFLPHAGGSREYYNNIYKNLVQLGDSEVTILTKKVPGWQEFDKKASTELFRIKRLFKPLPSWKIQELPKGIGPLLLTLWQVFRERPGIIHAGDLFPPGVIAMALKRICGIPYVVYCHGEEIPQIDQFRYQPRVRNRIYLNADAVIAASEFTRQNLLRLGVKDECIHKITPGVNASVFRSQTCGDALRKKHGLEGKVVILTVARLVPRKGHRAALQAFAKICCEIPEAKYLIVGTGPEELLLRKLVQDLGIGDRVTFAGYVASDQLPEVYNMCDLMLMTNRQEENGDVEGFGIVFLEANAAGRPVIGGRSGGAIEAIVDGVTGFLVNPDDPAEIAGVLRRLLLDRELREKLGASGRLRVWSDFNWESRAEVLREINGDILTMYNKQIKYAAKQQPVSDAFGDEGDARATAVSKLME